MKSSASKWTSLPKDLLLLIAERLHTRTDILRLRAVCHSFRSSVPLPPKTVIPDPAPILSFPVTGDEIPCDFSLTESTIYAIEPPDEISDAEAQDTAKTWLVKVQESESGKVQLRHPLTRCSFKNLSDKLPKSLNLLDYRVKEIAKAYNLEFIKVHNTSHHPSFFRKVVVSNCLKSTDDGFAIAVITDKAKLFVWRNEVKKWTNIDGNYFVDIVYHNEKFYVTGSEGLIIVDPKSLKVVTVMDQLQDSPLGLFYMVISLKDLYFISIRTWRYFNEDDTQVDLIAIKPDEEKQELVPMVRGLGGRVFFLGDDCQFSVSAKYISGCKQNCVYFTDSLLKASDDHPGIDAWIFDLKEDTTHPLSAFPGYSKIFWPPPSWLKQNPNSTSC